jgi:hypothetical protein
MRLSDAKKGGHSELLTHSYNDEKEYKKADKKMKKVNKFEEHEECQSVHYDSELSFTPLNILNGLICLSLGTKPFIMLRGNFKIQVTSN